MASILVGNPGRLVPVLAILLFWTGWYPTNSSAADGEGEKPASETKAAVAAEGILPGNTVAAVVIPDLLELRKQAGATHLSDMLAQPQLQAFFKPFLDKFKAGYAEMQKGPIPIPALKDLDAGLFSGRLILGAFTRDNQPGSPLGVAVILSAPKAEPLQGLLKLVFQGKVPPEGQVLPLGPGPAAPALVNQGNQLVFCLPQGDLPLILKRIKGEAAQEDQALSKNPHFLSCRSHMPKSKGWFYLHQEQVLKLVETFSPVPNAAEQVKGVMARLGLDSGPVVMTGLDVKEKEFVLDSFRPSKEALQTGTLIKPEHLKIAGLNAPYVSAEYYPPAGLLQDLKKQLVSRVPNGAQYFDQGLGMAQMWLGFDPQTEFLDNLGDVLVIAHTEINTAAPLSLFPGMVASTTVKDGEKMKKCLAQLKAFSGKGTALHPILDNLRLRTVQHGGKEILYLKGLPLLGAPSVCNLGDRVIVGTSVNAVRRTLDQLEQTDSILANKKFQDTIARLTAKPFSPDALPAGFGYGIDQGSGGGTLLLSGLGMGSGALLLGGLEKIRTGGAVQPMPIQIPGLPPEVGKVLGDPMTKVFLDTFQTVDLGIWPDEAFFAKYRRPRGYVVQWLKDGIHARTDLPVPTPADTHQSNMLVGVGVVAVVAAVAIPNLLRSRMAANEAAAVAGCKMYAEAQDIYRRTDWDKDGVLEYAQSVTGDFSLFEKTAGAGDVALVDAAFAGASSGPGAVPKAGYLFKVITAQGPKAPGGKKSYVADGNMTLGYALVAYPAKWDGTGRNTFLINNTGTVYQKDMGPETKQLVEALTEYNPDETWVVAD